MSMSSQTLPQNDASASNTIVVYFMDISDGFNPVELRSSITTVGKEQLQDALKEIEQLTASGEFCRCEDADCFLERDRSSKGYDALYLCFRKVAETENEPTAITRTWTMDGIHATLNSDSPNLASEKRRSIAPDVIANLSNIASICLKVAMVALVVFSVASIQGAVQDYYKQQALQESYAKLAVGEVLSERANTIETALVGDLSVLTVKYQYEDGTAAAENFFGRYSEGSIYAVKSPEIAGHQPDKAIVTGNIGEDNATVVVTYSRVKDSKLADSYYSGNAPIGGGPNIESIPIYQNP